VYAPSRELFEKITATVAVPETVEDPLPLIAVMVVDPPGGGVFGAL
jgi:hypothetical protein